MQLYHLNLCDYTNLGSVVPSADLRIIFIQILQYIDKMRLLEPFSLRSTRCHSQYQLRHLELCGYANMASVVSSMKIGIGFIQLLQYIDKMRLPAAAVSINSIV